jgi:hypothetical protein
MVGAASTEREISGDQFQLDDLLRQEENQEMTTRMQPINFVHKWYTPSILTYKLF